MGDGTQQGWATPPDEVTFELKEVSKPPLWLLGPPDSMDNKGGPKPPPGPLRLLKLPQLHCQLQVRGMPQLRKADCSWPWLRGPPRFPGECTQQEGRG